ncbi:MAG: restriction system-associated AAA family ATPase [Bacteroidetes bacterium]|nr:restriction system-associated AAA family ATPase [Bacteroidota bacterium]
MKLLRLKLGTPFRSLAAGFEVHFLHEWEHECCFEFHPFCLAGRNGSGKSNVLEALAAIFYHIECIYLGYRPDGFEFDEQTNPMGFRAEYSTPDDFELEYFVPYDVVEQFHAQQKSSVAEGSRAVAHIRISKSAGMRPEVHLLSHTDSSFDQSTLILLNRDQIKSVLPKYIVGYSSGHNEILSLPFFKMRFIHFDEYRDHLTKDVPYDGKPEGRMIYVDDQFSQAILICHFLFPSDAVTKVLEEKVGLKGIRRFRIIIRRHHRIPLAKERLNSMSVKDQKNNTRSTVELTSRLSGYLDENNQLQASLIDKLIKCSTAYHEDFSAYSDGEGYDLYLDYWVNDATQRAFQMHFGESSGPSEDFNKAKSALNLFQSFQTLLTLNHYNVDEVTKTELYQSDSLYVNETTSIPASHERITRFIEGELMKDGVTEKLYIKALSDGEHQLLHTIGLCLLYRYESALFLLDEPETHLNPDWRASYISTLRTAFEADEVTKNVMREVLLTSHSPFIISDCRKENVLVFEKNDEGRVEWHNPEFQTFGASATLITNEVFGRTETIGDFSNEELKRIEAKTGQPGQDALRLARELDRTLGDSIEKTLAISRILRGTRES